MWADVYGATCGTSGAHASVAVCGNGFRRRQAYADSGAEGNLRVKCHRHMEEKATRQARSDLVEAVMVEKVIRRQQGWWCM